MAGIKVLVKILLLFRTLVTEVLQQVFLDRTDGALLLGFRNRHAILDRRDRAAQGALQLDFRLVDI